MDATCAQCGEAFVAATARAKYCSDRCKKRLLDQRKRAGNVVPMTRPAPVAPDISPGIGAAMLAEFDAAALSTTTGAIALKLAGDVDLVNAGAPGYAATVAQLRAVVADLRTLAAPAKANPLLLLRQRHDAARASG